ncbi:MAG TPA: elongation factor P [Myxococcales bacterium]|jgi:elongation factor P|nr:elongation factor P [Myxococcales bacterium]
MAEMIDTSEFRNGLKIEIDGEPFEIVYFQHVKPGKGSAFVRTKIKSLTSGRTLEPTFRSGDKVAKADVEEREMQYLYEQAGEYHFMDAKSYEQTYLSKEQLGSAGNYLKENISAYILFYNGQPIGVSVPNAVDLKVIKCDPGMKGDTVTGAQKPATLESGYVVSVPLFINEGDVLRIDTRTGEYITRVNA